VLGLDSFNSICLPFFFFLKKKKTIFDKNDSSMGDIAKTYPKKY